MLYIFRYQEEGDLNMKSLAVPNICTVSAETPIEEISSLLESYPRNSIEVMPWPAFTYRPDASFTVAHGEDCILLKFFVKEKAIRAIYRYTNDPVYKDSCVEFFISFDKDDGYYNIEFNCIGTCLSGFGPTRNNRKLLPEALISKIKRLALIRDSNGAGKNLVEWELTCIIPLEVFVHHQIKCLRGRHCTVNFFKCGDELPEPHFLSWNGISSNSPDFHLPEFFGPMHFV